MRVEVESISDSIPSSIQERLIADVKTALQSIKTKNDQFIVNDTLWFWQNTAGKIRPTVVNSATYISKGFQDSLERLGWEKEPTIDEQNFDALIEFEVFSKTYSLSEDKFLTFLERLREGGFLDYGLQATAIYKQLVQSSTPFLPKALLPFEGMLACSEDRYHYRVGLEFETGNIASSFRAIEKLQGLYDSRKIDIGVFVTSQSKEDSAARIWPVSNRNGSFVELRQRRYDARRTYPHIDISFRPDGYDRSSDYLADDHLYEMKFLGETLEVDGNNYEVAVNWKGERKLVPAQNPKLL